MSTQCDIMKIISQINPIFKAMEAEILHVVQLCQYLLFVKFSSYKMKVALSAT